MVEDRVSVILCNTKSQYVSLKRRVIAINAVEHKIIIFSSCVLYGIQIVDI